MINFAQVTEKKLQDVLDRSRDSLFRLAQDMKIDNLSEQFLEEIVIPTSLYLHQEFPRRNKPYFICFTGG